MPENGDHIFWWSHNLADNRGLGVNLFGHGNPAENASLLMDIQFNVPVIKFSRRSGGTFLQCKTDKKVYLAHRGIATLGHSRVNQDALIQESCVDKVDAETGKWTRQFMIIGSLASKSLDHELSQFSLEIRRAAKVVMGRVDDERMMTEARAKKNPSSRDIAIGKLGAYFKEFSGETTIAARSATVADRFHGDVVDALERRMKTVQCLKSGPIDLAAITNTKGIIFEVKTSAKSQSVYTAIGQFIVDPQNRTRV